MGDPPINMEGSGLLKLHVAVECDDIIIMLVNFYYAF